MKTTFEKIVSSPSVKLGFGMVVFVVLVSIIWKIRRTIKQKESVTAYGIKGDGEITESRAKVLAEKLFDAMRKLGTDEETIFSVYDELAQYDKAILQVHEAFGLNSYALGQYDWVGVKLNLRQWLKKELSAKEFAQWELLYDEAVNK